MIAFALVVAGVVGLLGAAKTARGPEAPARPPLIALKPADPPAAVPPAAPPSKAAAAAKALSDARWDAADSAPLAPQASRLFDGAAPPRGETTRPESGDGFVQAAFRKIDDKP